ncbi:NAD(P)/FAD-dependent oxidoreductase [Mycolicibacterium sp. GCM10028919]|uniref:NAD(P)/FAD-dependent oxidoreductase n=1 Tax=Mycolicibacterium sp. GCM10028919 TaxID=3273401 RepID=UPI0036133714
MNEVYGANNAYPALDEHQVSQLGSYGARESVAVGDLLFEPGQSNYDFFYLVAATKLEVEACGADPVAVLGGANSAGQAALHLADSGSRVDLIVRGASLRASMSAYLADRIDEHPAITLRLGSEVTALHGSTHLEGITVTGPDAESTPQHCRGLFCFIGARPATQWCDGVLRDAKGFIVTDSALPETVLQGSWQTLNRRPLPFETSLPGVFAVGDVHAGSMKRVAAAVGEGASAVRSVHQALAR